MDRYTRQMVLEEIGRDGQDKLLNACVLCVGGGGLGAPALLYLAAAGIGTIGIADFDDIEESNLQRQILYDTNQTGRNKAETARQRLQSLNPHITINAHKDGLSAQNAEALFSGYDLVIDGTDNFSTKFLINDAGVKFGKPVVYGAIQRFNGQVSVFDSARGPCYRCLYPAPPAQTILNCAEAGIIGAVAGITGTTQAMQAIMLITGHESFEPLIGKLWMIDTKSMRTRLLDIPKDPACPVCSKARNEITLTSHPLTCNVPERKEHMSEISIDELKTLVEPLLVDVREQHEWDAGHMPGAMHCPLSGLLQGNLPDLPDDRPVILYCQKGKRSLRALDILQEAGPKSLRSIKGGYEVLALSHT